MNEVLPGLAQGDFGTYFAALWGVPPFGWQQDLLDRILTDRRWPGTIDLPTGTGKTSVIDIAIFALALGASDPPAEQWHPRRIAVVVDRRVIVDQADERSAHLAQRLGAANDGVLVAVAERLRRLAPGPGGCPSPTPLHHSVLRGGIIRDESWALRPDVPAVISSTVDQVGSRVLFRGYGVSRSMRPVQAGLLGNDTLYLLDEVHLARPFAETLDQLAWFRPGRSATEQLPNRWQIVRLSATPGAADQDRFPREPLAADDHPVLSRRLGARKPADLVEVAVPADPAHAHDKLADCAVRRTGDLIAAGARTVAVIVNRVDTARRVREALSDRREWDCHLITGRMRPVDRDRVFDTELRSRVTMGRTRDPRQRPTVLVSTQSIEAGADFDLDAIVTECASLDALRQRFGRVDRDGQVSAAGEPFRSTVMIASSALKSGDDPIYGGALAATWAWLRDQREVDFGLQQLSLPEGQAELDAMLPPVVHAPHLLPSHLDLWSQTSEYGVAADPVVAYWLHGIEASDQAEDVNVVWRDDLDPDLVDLANRDREVEAGLIGRLEACPPSSTEGVPVPLASLRRWLTAGASHVETEIADTRTPVAVQDREGPGNPQPVLRWRDDHAELIGLDHVSPGETVVLPAAAGGLRHLTWNPAAVEPVPDVVAIASRRPVLRLSEAFHRRLSGQGATASMVAPAVLGELSQRERRSAIRDHLAVAYEDSRLPTAERELLKRLLAVPEKALMIAAYPERVVHDTVVVSYVVSTQESVTGQGRGVEDDGGDSTSFEAAPVLLADHLRGVALWAEQLGRNLGLPEPVVDELATAGRLHDLGKLDPGFQRWLRGGSETETDAPLAKSTTTVAGGQRRRIQERSGYAPGLRHEMLSVALAGESLQDVSAHLVASHHGRGRYRFAPHPAVEEEPIETSVGTTRWSGTTRYDLDRLDGGVAERFWRLSRRWGPYGLAWLEAILRLADHQDSRTPGAGRES